MTLPVGLRPDLAAAAAATDALEPPRFQPLQDLQPHRWLKHSNFLAMTEPHSSSTETGPEFLRVLSHELRNNIAPIQNATHLLRMRSRADASLVPVIEIIERQLSGMLRTLDTLGEADRAHRGQTVLECAPVAVGALVEQALQVARASVEKRGRPVDVMLAADLPLANVDGPRIARVLAILLDNAARYTPPGEPITVSAAATDGHIEIRIRDRGAGIPADVLSHVFDFFAAPHQVGHGLGLGLPLAKALVDRHGGELCIGSPAPGGGTEVMVRLPAAGHGDSSSGAGGATGRVHPAEAADDARNAAAGAPAQAGDGAARSGGRRVLIADDSAAVRTSLTDLLEEMGHEVRAAGDGAEAVAMAQTWQPEFVLLDIHMPKLNGFDAARRIRGLFPPTVMQLVMMSGDDLDEVVRRGARQAGFDHCVDKGLDIGELATLLRREPPG